MKNTFYFKILKLILSLIFVCILTNGAVQSQQIQKLTSHNGNVTSVCYSTDGNYLASAGSDDKIIVWDARTFEKKFTVNSQLKTVRDLTWTSQNDKIFCAHEDANAFIGGKFQTFSVIDTRERSLSTPIDIRFELSNIARYGDSRKAYFGYFELESTTYSEIYSLVVGVFDDLTNTYQTVKIEYKNFSFNKENASIGRLPARIVFVDERTIVASIELIGDEDYLFLADIVEGKIIRDFSNTKNKYGSTCLAIRPDRSAFATANYGGESWIYLWEVKTGNLIGSFKGHKNDVLSLDYSPDGNYLVSGAKDNNIRLWDGKTKKTIKVLKGHTDNVNSVKFSPDGKNVASSSDDETVRIWNITEYLKGTK